MPEDNLEFDEVTKKAVVLAEVLIENPPKDYLPSADHLSRRAINFSLTRALLEANFSDEQKRYLVEHSYFRGDGIEYWCTNIRHCYYDVIQKTFCWLTDDYGIRLPEKIAKAVAAIDYSNNIYAQILAINLDETDGLQERFDYGEVTFPQLMATLASTAQALRSFTQKSYPDFDLERKISEIGQAMRKNEFEGYEFMSGFEPEEWAAIPSKKARTL